MLVKIGKIESQLFLIDKHVKISYIHQQYNNNVQCREIENIVNLCINIGYAKVYIFVESIFILFPYFKRKNIEYLELFM